MKLVFFGTPYFASRTLRYLLSSPCQVIAVVTRPDKPKGRFLKERFPPVKAFCQESFSSVPVFQPQKASDPIFLDQLRKLKADYFVVVGYGQILRKELLKIPLKGCINVHASLLPKYRGADPMRRALLEGEKKTGITIMDMVEELDAGDMYAQEEIKIPLEMNFSCLQEKLLDIGAPLLVKTLLKIQKGKGVAKKQDSAFSSYAKKIAPQEREISWNFPAEKIHNQIRAFSSSPGAWVWTFFGGEKKKVKILASRVSQQEGVPSQILEKSKKNLRVACQKKSIEILTIQLEGKKEMPIASFLAGVKKEFYF